MAKAFVRAGLVSQVVRQFAADQLLNAEDAAVAFAEEELTAEERVRALAELRALAESIRSGPRE